MDKKIRGFLIDVEDPLNTGERTIDDNLQSYYNTLNCDTIDVVTRNIGGKVFDIICDDEGLLKSNPIPSVFDSAENTLIYGNVFIAKCDYDTGEFCSLNDEEVKILEMQLKIIFIKREYQTEYCIMISGADM